MKRFEMVLKVKESNVKSMNAILEMETINFEATGVKEDSTLKSYSVEFDNGFKAVIEVCTGQSNAYVNAVLFNTDGFEVCVLEPAEGLDGTYTFEADEVVYEVELMATPEIKMRKAYISVLNDDVDGRTNAFRELFVGQINAFSGDKGKELIQEIVSRNAHKDLMAVLEEVKKVIETDMTVTAFNSMIIDEELDEAYMIIISYVEQ